MIRQALAPIALTVVAVGWVAAVLLTGSWTNPACSGLAGLLVVMVPWMWVEWSRARRAELNEEDSWPDR